MAIQTKDRGILRRNKISVRCWKGIQEEKNFQTSVMSAARMNTAQDRVEKLENESRKRVIARLNKWDDFRIRRDQAIMAYYIAKKLQKIVLR